MKNSSDKYISETMQEKLKNIKADEALINATLDLIRNSDNGGTPRLSAIDSDYVKTKAKVPSSSMPIIICTGVVAIAVCMTVICLSTFINFNKQPENSEMAVACEENRVIYSPYAAEVRTNTRAMPAGRTAPDKVELASENFEEENTTSDEEIALCDASAKIGY